MKLTKQTIIRSVYTCTEASGMFSMSLSAVSVGSKSGRRSNACFRCSAASYKYNNMLDFIIFNHQIIYIYKEGKIINSFLYTEVRRTE